MSNGAATMRWFMDRDNHGRWYVIPVARTAEWITWRDKTEIHLTRPDDAPPPDYARSIVSPSRVEFSYPEPRIAR